MSWKMNAVVNGMMIAIVMMVQCFSLPSLWAAEDLSHFVVKVASEECQRLGKRLVGSGFLISHEEDVYVLTSEHVLLHSQSNEICHRISSPALGVEPIETVLHAIEWGNGLALLKVKDSQSLQDSLAGNQYPRPYRTVLGEEVEVGEKAFPAGYGYFQEGFMEVEGALARISSIHQKFSYRLFPLVNQMIDVADVAKAEFGMSGGALLNLDRTGYVGTISHKYYDSGQMVEEHLPPVDRDQTEKTRVGRHILAVPATVARKWLDQRVFRAGEPAPPTYFRVLELQVSPKGEILDSVQAYREHFLLKQSRVRLTSEEKRRPEIDHCFTSMELAAREIGGDGSDGPGGMARPPRAEGSGVDDASEGEAETETDREKQSSQGRSGQADTGDGSDGPGGLEAIGGAPLVGVSGDEISRFFVEVKKIDDEAFPLSLRTLLESPIQDSIQDWISSHLRTLARGGMIRIPLFVRVDQAAGLLDSRKDLLEKKCFSSLPEFFGFLGDPNLVPIQERDLVDTGDVKKNLKAIGARIDEKSNELRALVEIEKSKVDEQGFDDTGLEQALRFVDRLDNFGDLLRSDGWEWMAISKNLLDWLIDIDPWKPFYSGRISASVGRVSDELRSLIDDAGKEMKRLGEIRLPDQK